MDFHSNKLQHLELDASKSYIKYVDLLAVRLVDVSDAVSKLNLFYEHVVRDKVSAAVTDNQSTDVRLHNACWDEVEKLRALQQSTKNAQEAYVRGCEGYLEARRDSLIKNTAEAREIAAQRKAQLHSSEDEFKFAYVG